MTTVLDSPWAGSVYSPPTPLDIATLETAIVNQIAARISAIEVVHFPDQPNAYRMTHRTGSALVRYQGAKYRKLLDATAVVQERELEFEVTLLMRDLGWNVGGGADGAGPGAYAMLEAIRAALTGFRIAGCSKMYPLHERFVDRDKQGGVWIYAIVFAFTTAALEAASADNYPLLIKAVAQEHGGVTTVSLAPAPYSFDGNGQVHLPNGNLVAAVVSNPASGAAYADRLDYTLDTVNGIITRIAGGAIAAGAAVNIEYAYAEAVTASGGAGNAPLG